MKKLDIKHLFYTSVLTILNVDAKVARLSIKDCSADTYAGIQLVNARFSAPGVDLKGVYTRLSHSATLSSEHAEHGFKRRVTYYG